MPTRSLLVLPLLLAACGGSDAGETPLVGAWVSADATARYAFEADGSFTFDEDGGGEGDPGEHFTGTWLAEDDGSLILDGTSNDAPARVLVSHYANEETFVWGALLPSADVDGLVGTWSGWYALGTPGEPDPTIDPSELVLAADMTFTSVQGTGTWAETAYGISLTVAGDDPEALAVVDRAAIAGPRYVFSRE